MIEFVVYGTPVTQGSKKIARGRLIDDDPAALRRWRANIVQTAREHYQGEPLGGPIRLTVTFFLKRPKRHYRTGRFADQLRDDAPPVYCDAKPDADKLVRAVGDALTDAGVWRDDAQAAVLNVRKRYAPDGRTEGAAIRIAPLPTTE